MIFKNFQLSKFERNSKKAHFLNCFLWHTFGVFISRKKCRHHFQKTMKMTREDKSKFSHEKKNDQNFLQDFMRIEKSWSGKERNDFQKKGFHFFLEVRKLFWKPNENWLRGEFGFFCRFSVQRVQKMLWGFFTVRCRSGLTKEILWQTPTTSDFFSLTLNFL